MPRQRASAGIGQPDMGSPHLTVGDYNAKIYIGLCLIRARSAADGECRVGPGARRTIADSHRSRRVGIECIPPGGFEVTR
jgi:hypothetical protein